VQNTEASVQAQTDARMHEVIDDSGLDLANILANNPCHSCRQSVPFLQTIRAISFKWWGQRPAPFGPYAPRGFALCHSPFKATSALPASSQPFN